MTTTFPCKSKIPHHPQSVDNKLCAHYTIIVVDFVDFTFINYVGFAPFVGIPFVQKAISVT